MANENARQEEREEPKEPRRVSRRRFLVGSGLAVGGAVVGGVAGSTVAPTAAEAERGATAVALPATDVALADVPLTPAIGRIVVDPQYCCECRTCELACSLAHGNVVNPRLSGIRIGRDELASILADPVTCRQCDAASCMAACPTGALHADAVTNAKVIDQVKCIGCQRCLNACVFAGQSRITYDPAKNKCFKCDLCGGDPQCVKACTTFAATFERRGA